MAHPHYVAHQSHARPKGEEMIDLEDYEECESPCPIDSPCEECEGYWERMRAEGFWVDGQGWTDKAVKEGEK